MRAPPSKTQLRRSHPPPPANRDSLLRSRPPACAGRPSSGGDCRRASPASRIRAGCPGTNLRSSRWRSMKREWSVPPWDAAGTSRHACRRTNRPQWDDPTPAWEYIGARSTPARFGRYPSGTRIFGSPAMDSETRRSPQTLQYGATCRDGACCKKAGTDERGEALEPAPDKARDQGGDPTHDRGSGGRVASTISRDGETAIHLHSTPFTTWFRLQRCVARNGSTDGRTHSAIRSLRSRTDTWPLMRARCRAAPS